jgi:hypothetical protein
MARQMMLLTTLVVLGLVAHSADALNVIEGSKGNSMYATKLGSRSERREEFM